VAGENEPGIERDERCRGRSCLIRLDTQSRIGRPEAAVPVPHEGIAGEEDAILPTERDAAGGVARGVDHLESTNHIAGREYEVGSEWLDPEHPKKHTYRTPACGRPLSPREDRGVEPVDRDTSTGQTAQLGGVPHVIRVPMGQDDVPDVCWLVTKPSQGRDYRPRAAWHPGIDEQDSVVELDEMGIADPQTLYSLDAVRDPHDDQYRPELSRWIRPSIYRAMAFHPLHREPPHLG
jgi:hypothetical protein